MGIGLIAEDRFRACCFCGLATRLRPLTEKIPKALVEVAGRPFLERQLDLLKQNSIVEVVLCVGYLGEMIERRYGDEEALGIRIRYSFDGPILLGTGGAIKRASALLPDAFFVLYGDSYLPIDFQAVAAGLNRIASVSTASARNCRKCALSIVGSWSARDRSLMILPTMFRSDCTRIHLPQPASSQRLTVSVKRSWYCRRWLSVCGSGFQA
jgi:hypothetical protein